MEAMIVLLLVKKNNNIFKIFFNLRKYILKLQKTKYFFIEIF